MKAAYPPFVPMHERVPVGVVGRARIEHFDVSPREEDLMCVRSAFSREMPVPAGRYCRLVVNKSLMMTDTPSEQFDNLEFVRKAKGDVLIAGLGIGMVVVPVLQKESVTSVTVIEKYRDVITLVQPHIEHEKLTVILSDIFEWKPPRGTKWDTIYFDIWPDRCVENLEGITKLKRRYARRRRPGGWMGAWCEDELRACKREGRWR